MRIIEQKIEWKDEHRPPIIVPIGNIHIGSPDFNKKAFETTLENIRKYPNSCVMHF